MNTMVNIYLIGSRMKHCDVETCIHNIYAMETEYETNTCLFSRSKAYTYERKIWELVHENP